MQPPGPPPGPPPGSPPGAPPHQPPQGFAPHGAPQGGYPPMGPPPGPARPATPMTAQQKLAIGLGVTALAIVIAILSKSWVTIDEEGGIGPSGLQECRRGVCVGVPWDPVGKLIGEDVPIFATIGMIAGLLAAAGIGAAGVLAWTRNLAKMPVQPTRISLGVAAFGSTFMMVRVMTHERLSDEVSIGWAAVVGIGALVTAGVLLQKLAPMVAQAKAAMPNLPQLPGAQAVGQPPAYGQPAYGQHGQAPQGHAPYAQPPQQGHAQPGHPPQQAYPQHGQPQHGQPQHGQPQHGQPQAQPMSAQQLGSAPTMAAAPAPGGQPTYPCPRCQKSLVFVAQYQRWFCEACRQYA